MDGTAFFNQDTDAPAGRSDSAELEMTHAQIESVEHLQSIIDAMPFAILILNNQRQIVAANNDVLDMVQLDISQVLGKRPGELVGCVHANDGPDGCGTGIYCRVCGAVNAILKCLHTTERQAEECRITLTDGHALDWEVTVSPLTVKDYPLMLTAIRDISDHKRKIALEHIFFHDILNTIGAVVGFTKIMAEENSENEELQEVIHLTNELMEEVLNQRDLALAESGDLELRKETVHAQSFLERLGQLYRSHSVAEHRKLVINAPDDLHFESDPRLLKRVLGNMLKNAFEASSKGQIVYLFCIVETDSITFGVRNSSVMTKETLLQVFNRSFSTKEESGRGLGTYSMKLLGEKYLGGKVSCISEPGIGTVFSLTLSI